jgi:hypothetical protein
MSHAIQLSESPSVPGVVHAGAEAMSLEAAAWLAAASRSADGCRDRMFLARFAVHLVHQFRCEERALQSGAQRTFARRCEDNRRLARRLRELMAEAELGSEIEGGIRDFLRAWQSHQRRASARRLIPRIGAVA